MPHAEGRQQYLRPLHPRTSKAEAATAAAAAAAAAAVADAAETAAAVMTAVEEEAEEPRKKHDLGVCSCQQHEVQELAKLPGNVRDGEETS